MTTRCALLVGSRSRDPLKFDGNLLVLHELKIGETLGNVTLNKVKMWVQIHDLPASFFSELVGRVLENFVGKFVDYDVKNTYTFANPYMRLRGDHEF
ncbi:hypothetical protein LINPERHAP1_LOCUS6973 [Linum perenne]